MSKSRALDEFGKEIMYGTGQRLQEYRKRKNYVKEVMKAHALYHHGHSHTTPKLQPHHRLIAATATASPTVSLSFGI